MPPRDTKERILDAAEELFAEHGFEATSLRAITGAADVNLAAINYHFGSKEALIRAVFARRAGPINAERLERLEQAEAAAGSGPPALEDILRAFLLPPLRRSADDDRCGKAMRRLIGKVHAEGSEHLDSTLTDLFGEVARAFGAALQHALPHLKREDVAWRFLFTLGVMAFTMSDKRKLAFLSHGQCDSSDTESALDQMVAFVAAGLRAAPVSRAQEKAS